MVPSRAFHPGTDEFWNEPAVPIIRHDQLYASHDGVGGVFSDFFIVIASKAKQSRSGKFGPCRPDNPLPVGMTPSFWREQSFRNQLTIPCAGEGWTPMGTLPYPPVAHLPLQHCTGVWFFRYSGDKSAIHDGSMTFA